MHRFISGYLCGAFFLYLSVVEVLYAQTETWQENQQVVRTLMEQEIAALMQTHQQDTGQAPLWVDEGGISAMSLKALYGVGDERFVLVEHRGREYLFAPGQRVNHKLAPGNQPVKIKRITGRCVKFEHAEEHLQHCIEPTLP